jgi:hypothetical protein
MYAVHSHPIAFGRSLPLAESGGCGRVKRERRPGLNRTALSAAACLGWEINPDVPYTKCLNSASAEWRP